MIQGLKFAKVFFINSLLFNHVCLAQISKQPLWQNNKFVLYSDRVVQGNYMVKALSDTELVSNYQSSANLFKSADISFKFSINGKDNEMPSGTDHHFTCIGKEGTCVTPVIKFGTQLKDSSNLKDNTYLPPNTSFEVSVDMSNVFDAFKSQGY